MYENVKMPPEHHLWGDETTFPETCLLSVDERVRYQSYKKKKTLKATYMKEQDNQKFIFWVFSATYVP